MANNKEFYSRIVHKHDIEANWNKATGFTPLQGEIIVYDKDDTYNYERIKIGDGITKVINLPFILDSVDEMVEDVVADLGAITIDIGQADSTTPNGINADSVGGLTKDNLVIINLKNATNNNEIYKSIEPLKNDDKYFFPLTSADQVIKKDGSRLEIAAGVNADLLDGHSANYFATQENINDLSKQVIKTYLHSSGSLIGSGENGKFKATKNGVYHNFIIEENESVGLNTLTWDGNPSGRHSIIINNDDTAYLVGVQISNTAFTLEDLANGWSYTLKDIQNDGTVTNTNVTSEYDFDTIDTSTPGMILFYSSYLQGYISSIYELTDEVLSIFPTAKIGTHFTYFDLKSYGKVFVTSFTINNFSFKNGNSYKVKNGEESEIELIKDTWYSFILDEDTINFKSGGANLNFKIIGSTTQPASPKENTIWVETDTPIGKHQFSWSTPSTRADGSPLQTGDIWGRCTSHTEIEINLFKNNTIKLPIQDIWMWNGTEWIWQNAKIYQNSAWKDLYYLQYENQWYFWRTSTINSQPKPSDFVGKNKVAQGYYADTSTSISMNMADSYSGIATTYVFLDTDETINITFTTDDAGTVTINNAHIGNLTSCTATALNCPFKKGWNKLEVCYTEGSGGDGWVTSPRISSIASIKKMYARINNTL